jgi:hypothetical protein
MLNIILLVTVMETAQNFLYVDFVGILITFMPRNVNTAMA